jgi:hypothetical protein
MLTLYVVAIVIAVVAAVVAPFKLRATLKGRLRSGSRLLAPGATVTVVGTIRETNDLVESPISAKRGVLVHTQAELPEMGPDGPVIMKTQLMVPFELDTADGPILVDGTIADVVMKPTSVSPRSLERESAFVVAHGRSAEIAKVATFRELVLAPGARVSVHGVAVIDELAREERGYRDPVPTRTRIVAPAKYPITIGEPDR